MTVPYVFEYVSAGRTSTRNRTLGDMLFDLRAEIGMATDSKVGQSENPALMVLLRRTQETLYNDYDWPHMSGVWFDVSLAAGQRYYDFPANLDYERAARAAVYWGSVWQAMEYGFDTRHYNQFNSDNNERSDPAMRWRVYDDTQFEVWPIPATAGTMRLTGTRALGLFQQASDICSLDGTMVVLVAAAERLAGKPRGKALEQIAARYLANAKARTNNSTESFRIGSHGAGRHRPHGITISVRS